MNKFLLFAYDDYYPLGGLSDLKGVFENKSDLIYFAEHNCSNYVHLDIFNFETEETIQLDTEDKYDFDYLNQHLPNVFFGNNSEFF